MNKNIKVNSSYVNGFNFNFDGVEGYHFIMMIASELITDINKIEFKEDEFDKGKYYASESPSKFEDIYNEYDNAIKQCQLINSLYLKADILFNLIKESVLNNTNSPYYLFLHRKGNNGKCPVDIITDALDKFQEFIITTKEKSESNNKISIDYTEYNDKFKKLFK